MTQKSESVREAEQTAKEWLANQSVLLPVDHDRLDGSWFEGYENQIALLLTAYAKSVTLKLAEEAEDAEAEAERHALNLLNFDWSGE